MFDSWSVSVPGSWRDDRAYLDIETMKVPCEYRFASGERLGRRWSAFAAGVANYGTIVLIERTAGEEDFLTGVAMAVEPSREVVYRATRKFDEMILKGRYTYARRGPAPMPFYPAMPGAESLTWIQERNLPDGLRDLREMELESRLVPETYSVDAALVLVHLLRDVVELIVAYGEPDELCETWCERVLSDRTFAYSVLFGDE